VAAAAWTSKSSFDATKCKGPGAIPGLLLYALKNYSGPAVLGTFRGITAAGYDRGGTAAPGDDMRKKILVFGGGLLLQAIFVIAQNNGSLAANGNKPCPKLGYCPPGSCAADGTTRACNIKNCSPQHCAR
jgi:hypothetical protein